MIDLFIFNFPCESPLLCNIYIYVGKYKVDKTTFKDEVFRKIVTCCRCWQILCKCCHISLLCVWTPLRADRWGGGFSLSLSVSLISIWNMIPTPFGSLRITSFAAALPLPSLFPYSFIHSPLTIKFLFYPVSSITPHTLFSEYIKSKPTYLFR